MQGRDFPFDDCGRSFTCFPMENPSGKAEALVCNIDVQLYLMTHKVSYLWMILGRKGKVCGHPP